MDLKKLKYIKNTGKLPGFANGLVNYTPLSILPTSAELDNLENKLYKSGIRTAGGNTSTTPDKKSTSGVIGNIVSNAGDIGAGLLGLAGQYINGSMPIASADDFFKNARMTQGNLGGYMYDILGDGGESQAMDLVKSNTTANTLAMAASGTAAGAAVGGPIGAGVGFLVGGIGGLLSGNKAKKEQERQILLANIKKNDKNVYGHDLAYTNMLRDRFSKEYGDQESQQLYGAANGKRPVWTPEGLAALKATAHVSNGEVVGNLAEGTATRIPGRKNNKDTKLASLADGDFVISNKYGLSDYAASTGDYIGALNLQEMLLGGMRNKHGYKNGKLPGLKDGFSLSATLPSIFNATVGLDQISRSNDMLSAPSSYRSNPYEGLLSGLDDIRVNTLPIYNNNKNLEAKTRNAIVRSGGLSAGQIAAALLSGGYNTMLANANALMNAQLQNNQYKTNAITTKYDAGAKDAALRSATNQWDYDKYAAAHNAAMQQNQMGFYNIANAWREGYKNNWDREQFEKMYGLYATDVKNKEMYYQFLRNGGMDKPINDLKYAKLRIDNDGLYGLRNTPDTVLARSDLYKKYMVDPFSIEKINYMKIPQKSAQELFNDLRGIAPGWQPEDTSLLNMFMPSLQVNASTQPEKNRLKKQNTQPATLQKRRSVVAAQKPSETKQPMVFRPEELSFGAQSVLKMVESNRQATLGNLSNTNAKTKKTPKLVAKSNKQALKNLFEYITLGKKEYNKRRTK